MVWKKHWTKMNELNEWLQSNEGSSNWPWYQSINPWTEQRTGDDQTTRSLGSKSVEALLNDVPQR